MRRGHFLNVHHYHDHHNQVLYRLRPEVTKADFYTVAVLAYWTGDRFFVEKIVECVNKEVENKHYQENALAEQPVLFFESWVKEHLKSFSWKEDTIPAFFHRRFRPCIQKAAWLSRCAKDGEQEEKDGTFLGSSSFWSPQ